MRAARPSLVIFDCDGVLLDSELPVNRVFTEALAEIGLVMSIAECHARYRGRRFADCLADIERELGRAVPEEWLSSLRTRAHRVLDEEVGGVPHALATATALHAAHVPLCVASSSNENYLQRMLTKTGFAPFFGGRLFSATMVARGKPAPDLFLHAARTMGHAPQDCVVVEDSIPGVRAAVAAHMRVIGYAGDEYCDAATFSRAGAEVIADLRKLPSLFLPAA